MSTKVEIQKSRVDFHILDHRKRLTRGNVRWSEYFRCGGKNIGDDNNSDGVCKLRSGGFAYRVGCVLIGIFDCPQDAELAAQTSGGFLSLAAYRRVEMLLARLSKGKVA
jgi:hypothetical protein